MLWLLVYFLKYFVTIDLERALLLLSALLLLEDNGKCMYILTIYYEYFLPLTSNQFQLELTFLMYTSYNLIPLNIIM